KFGGEGGKKVRCRTGVISQEPEYLSGPPHSCCRAAVSAARRSPRRMPLQKPRARKLLRKKKNESWAMRPRPYKSDSLSWRKLVMQNRPVWLVSGSAFVSRVLGSTGRWPVVRGSLPRTAWRSQLVWQPCIRQAAECCRLAACAPQHLRRARHPIVLA